jgi:hypothetical protein
MTYVILYTVFMGLQCIFCVLLTMLIFFPDSEGKNRTFGGQSSKAGQSIIVPY